MRTHYRETSYRDGNLRECLPPLTVIYNIQFNWTNCRIAVLGHISADDPSHLLSSPAPDGLVSTFGTMLSRLGAEDSEGPFVTKERQELERRRLQLEVSWGEGDLLSQLTRVPSLCAGHGMPAFLSSFPFITFLL